MRVFTAVALPDYIKDELAAFRQTRIPTARWDHHDDFHLTLRFIGDVDTATYERYKAALAKVKAAPFELVLQGVGRFPPQVKRPPTVLWVGMQLTPELTDLQAKVTSILEAEGLGKDKHEGYSPHITLARLRTDHRLDELDRFLMAHAAFKTSAISVTEFVMYQRDPIPNGGNYRQIDKFPLKK
jgi:2'-5' RNA ligase